MILIDPPLVPSRGRMWSHLASDTSYDELHRFAQTLGIPQRGFDRDHYDIPAERYASVVAAGALPISSRELIVRLKAAGLRRRKAEMLAPKKPGRSYGIGIRGSSWPAGAYTPGAPLRESCGTARSLTIVTISLPTRA